MTNTAGPTPAGWYADPSGSGKLRWWDGSTWTAHLAPQQTPAPVATPVVQTPVVQTPVVQTPAVHPPVLPPFQIATQAGQPAYDPFAGSQNTVQQASPYGTAYTDDFARPVQSNTVGAWLLAFSGLLTTIGIVIYGAIAGFAFTSSYNLGGYLGVGAVVYLITLFFAEADRRRLKSLGYLRVPSLWWMLLVPPLIYLILRTVAVWGEVRRGLAPLITYVVVNVVSGILLSVAFAVLFSGALHAGSTGSAYATEFTAGIEKGLDQHGGNYTVVCPTTIPSIVGARFSCTATDAATGTAHTLNIQVVEGSDGKPAVKLLSVTPPISG